MMVLGNLGGGEPTNYEVLASTRQQIDLSDDGRGVQKKVSWQSKISHIWFFAGIIFPSHTHKL